MALQLLPGETQCHLQHPSLFPQDWSLITSSLPLVVQLARGSAGVRPSMVSLLMVARMRAQQLLQWMKQFSLHPAVVM